MGRSIGIDFGTTNTLVSYVNSKGKVVNYITEDGSTLIPSVVFFKTKYQDDWLIGEEAKQEMLLNPQAGVENFKSFLGKSNYFFDIITDETEEELRISPREVTRFFIEEVLKKVEESFIEEFDDYEPIDSVVVSVPAKFNYVERGAIKNSVLDANIDNVRIVPESTAAAYAHINLVEKNEKSNTILVYDFGGGTFDVSLLQVMDNGTYREAVVPGGEKSLGGNKLTENIAKSIVDVIEDECGLVIPVLDDEEKYNEKKYGMSRQTYLRNYREILNVSNSVKEISSKIKSDTKRSFVLNLRDDNGLLDPIEVTYSKQDVENLIGEDINRTIDITLKMLSEARLNSIDNIDSVVLAGGSSNITMVKYELEKALNRDILRADDVMTIISRGAALFAQEAQEGKLLIATQTNTEIGIKAKVDHIPNAFVPIITCGLDLPTGEITKDFKLMKDGQDSIAIEIYERDINNYPNAKKTNSRGVTWVDRFVIDNLPDGLSKDEITVSVSLSIDEDGTMDVRAKIKDSNGYVIDNTDITVMVESNLG